jgi:hypothetical protein
VPDEPGPDQPEAPHIPYAPEDGAYAAIVSEYMGLQRGGADPLGAAMITAAHLVFMRLAAEAGQQQA